MTLQNVVKSIQDIMRQDQGVDGDAQRLSQLVWMLFLKIVDDEEKQYELVNPRYHSAIPEKLRWRNWATNPEGMTGDDLLDFMNNKLFRSLKELKAQEGNQLGLLVKEVFTDSYNYMKSGTLIRQVVNKINEIDFNKKDDRHHFNEIYEHLLKELQSAGNYGEFYTPRALTQFVVEMVNPKLGETVLDPACGTGGFLVNTIEHVQKEVKNNKDEKLLERSIRGIEIKQLPYTLAVTNLILHGVEAPNQIQRGDSLSRPLREYGPKDRVDVIVANPPFGGVVKDGTAGNFPHEFRTKETADLFLVLFMHLLKPTGRAGIVLPDGSLFGEGVKSAIKRKLLEECNLHTIVRLPQGVFNPYAGVNTNLLFFEKGNPTKEIWYYELPLPEGMKQYTKNRGITSTEFEPVKKWWRKRVQNEHAWKVTIGDIEKRYYNLDFKNPNVNPDLTNKTPKQIIDDLSKKEVEIISIINEINDFL
ncbi:MAG: class I SAM-dependent DNA methyltransferase [Patescibacteria group bacterium]|nr:class I SAM-dependent DNA methyltransferase [Patescibacteria group bacterium]